MMDQYGIRAENISIIDHGTLGFQSSGAESCDSIRQQFDLSPDEKALLFF
jgi:hypothetical protein